jgi:hypothetical protein
MLVVGKGPEEKMRIKIQAQSYMFTKKVKTDLSTKIKSTFLLNQDP